MAVLLCCDEVHLRIEATFKEETLQTNLAQSAGAVAQRGNTAAQRESGAAQPAAPRRAASPLTSQTPAAPRRGRIVQTDAAAPPFRFFNSQLLKITQLTPTMRRFTLRGASLNQLADPGFDQRIKLVLPTAGESAAAAVEELAAASDWYQRWSEMPEAVRPVIRTYTTREVRHCDSAPELSEVDIDAVVHTPAGPASRWVQSAQPGDTVWLLGPNRRYSGDSGGLDFVPPPVTMWHLLAGDETAAPAISRILEQLPKAANGIVLLELPNPADGAYLPHHPGFKIFVTARKDAHGEELFRLFSQNFKVRAGVTERQDPCDIDVDRELLWEVPRGAAGGAELQSTGVYAWVAGEAGMVKRIRRYLIRDMGIDRRSAAFMGYWREGRAQD
ncbi:siderophore-interacting protein [Leucobacter sp. OH1287]|nr:siderophore-interacting protein [Leucobacter sp. OH1287]